MVTKDLNFMNKIKTRALVRKHAVWMNTKCTPIPNVLIHNPKLSSKKGYSGIYLRDYQLELVEKIINDFKKTYEDLNFRIDVHEYFRLFQIGTGDGKSFFIPYLLEHIVKISL